MPPSLGHAISSGLRADLRSALLLSRSWVGSRRIASWSIRSANKRRRGAANGAGATRRDLIVSGRLTWIPARPRRFCRKKPRRPADKPDELQCAARRFCACRRRSMLGRPPRGLWGGLHGRLQAAASASACRRRTVPAGAGSGGMRRRVPLQRNRRGAAPAGRPDGQTALPPLPHQTRVSGATRHRACDLGSTSTRRPRPARRAETDPRLPQTDRARLQREALRRQALQELGSLSALWRFQFLRRSDVAQRSPHEVTGITGGAGRGEVTRCWSPDKDRRAVPCQRPRRRQTGTQSCPVTWRALRTRTRQRSLCCAATGERRRFCPDAACLCGVRQ